MTSTFYTVEVGNDSESIDFSWEFDTLKEAKIKARYYLSNDYQRIIEKSTPYLYARILKHGELNHGSCEHDFFRDEQGKVKMY